MPFRLLAAYSFVVFAGLAVPVVGIAACSSENTMGDTEQSETAGVESDTPAARAPAEPVARTHSPSRRAEAIAAPRARWHRYLPGMFK